MLARTLRRKPLVNWSELERKDRRDASGAPNRSRGQRSYIQGLRRISGAAVGVAESEVIGLCEDHLAILDHSDRDGFEVDVIKPHGPVRVRRGGHHNGGRRQTEGEMVVLISVEVTATEDTAEIGYLFCPAGVLPPGLM